MERWSGLAVVFASVGLFALLGGLTAVVLDALAPGYYPGVFPPAHMNGHAAGTGLLVGVSQGAGLGLVVGLGMVVRRWLSGEGSWRVLAQWWLAVVAVGVVGGIIGGGIGRAIGTWAPDSYRTLATRYEGTIRGSKAAFSAQDVGLGLGASQGLLVGCAAGAVVGVGAGWVRYSRTRRCT